MADNATRALIQRSLCTPSYPVMGACHPVTETCTRTFLPQILRQRDRVPNQDSHLAVRIQTLLPHLRFGMRNPIDTQPQHCLVWLREKARPLGDTSRLRLMGEVSSVHLCLRYRAPRLMRQMEWPNGCDRLVAPIFTITTTIPPSLGVTWEYILCRLLIMSRYHRSRHTWPT